MVINNKFHIFQPSLSKVVVDAAIEEPQMHLRVGFRGQDAALPHAVDGDCRLHPVINAILTLF